VVDDREGGGVSRPLRVEGGISEDQVSTINKAFLRGVSRPYYQI
jgi:hypothetical protein